MTAPSLNRTLHEMTADLESRLDPSEVWQRGRRRRLRSAGAIAGIAAASVAVVAAVSGGLAGTGSTPDPAPRPTPGPTPESPYPTGPDLPEVDENATLGVVTEDQVLPQTDPADWADLPAYPEDLGYWLTPERPVPLAEDPVTRATTAIQYDLGGGEANVVVIGDDGRWRWIDVSDLEFSTAGQTHFGLERGSLSPDGTRLALGQPDGITVVDLTTARTTEYAVPGLGPDWKNRSPFWTADGAAVLISQSYVHASPPGDFHYVPGWRIALGDGTVSRVPWDPNYAAQFDDGSVIANQWSERLGHRWERWSPEGDRTELDISTDLLGVLNEASAHRDLWVARRELTLTSSERAWDRDGFVALDQTGEVVSMLPVKGVHANGGGGRVLGWIDETVVVLAMPGPDGNPSGTVAWDVLSGQLWRGPELLSSSVVTVTP